jgi:ligand-binding SRPBCC domain-containing protein
MTTQATTGIRRSTLIDAPLEKVFRYYSDPEKLSEVWPSFIEAHDVTRSAEGWPHEFAWTYKMAGVKLEGRTVNVEFEPNRRYVAETKGGIDSRFETTFETQGGKTLVTEDIQYHVPVPLLGRIAERVLAKLNENELATIHANLKARMEAEE